MSGLMNLYVGRSGQAAVMAEFLIRGYNVATPEVDRGDDLFVVQDENGDLSRIQVKTATAKEKKRGGYSAQFNVPIKQLQRAARPDIDYAIAVRLKDRWTAMTRSPAPRPAFSVFATTGAAGRISSTDRVIRRPSGGAFASAVLCTAQPLDLMPQTAHVEIVAVLSAVE